MACEVLMVTSAIRNLVREQKVEQITMTIQTGGISLPDWLSDLPGDARVTTSVNSNRRTGMSTPSTTPVATSISQTLPGLFFTKVKISRSSSGLTFPK